MWDSRPELLLTLRLRGAPSHYYVFHVLQSDAFGPTKLVSPQGAAPRLSLGWCKPD